MSKIQELDNINISIKSHKLLKQLLKENPTLEHLIRNSENETDLLIGVRKWILSDLKARPDVLRFYSGRHPDKKLFEKLKWRDYAAVRILDYIAYAGKEYKDNNIHGETAVTNPFKLIWLAAVRGTGGAKPYFFEDMLHLFRQYSGKTERKIPSLSTVERWMKRHPSGLDHNIIKIREKNRNRILGIIIKKIDKKEISDTKYQFKKGMSQNQKYLKASEWWNDKLFHLRFAVRNPDLLNEMLGYSLDPDTMNILYDAHRAGIPTFATPYYLSLINVNVPDFAIGADMAIRDYLLHSRKLVEEFGNIIAWEKEDIIEPGKPNAAGWILPSLHNVHRRYPEVAILIPSSVGRACGGLCTSCQRMYEFQRGNLNFNLDKLKPHTSWPYRLLEYMEYFEEDSQLRDILITGGDGLMSSDETLRQIFEAIYNMALRKKEANKKRKKGTKHAEIIRVRIGTRLPVYLPQRITPELTRLLREFKEKASKIGIKQFIIQTHIQTPMEVTPEAQEAIRKFISAGWLVTNQVVFTVSASRRGHITKLRQVLNKTGVLPYYTFSVKGYMENYRNFATNARIVQEQIEEKVIGTVSEKYHPEITELSLHPEQIIKNISRLKKSANYPLLATDRNVLNLPGVGKSLTFRVIGITRYGRRILEFDHDKSRRHSPIIEKTGKIIIIESKSVSEYLNQLENIGEDISEYESVYGYSLGMTETRLPIYEYPEYDYQVTDELTNFEINGNHT